MFAIGVGLAYEFNGAKMEYLGLAQEVQKNNWHLSSDTVKLKSDFTLLPLCPCLPRFNGSSTTSSWSRSDPSLTNEHYLRRSRLFQSYREVSSLCSGVSNLHLELSSGTVDAPRCSSHRWYQPLGHRER